MIWGKPVNLWNGVVTAAAGVVSIILIQIVGADPETVAQLLAAIVLFLGSVGALIASQPPTIPDGGTVHVQTPSGQKDATATLSVNGGGNVEATPVEPT